MSGESASHPPADAWVAAIHLSEDDFSPIGTGLVIDPHRILTCAHVVTLTEGITREPLWVAFPKAGQSSGQRRRVVSVKLAEGGRIADLAVLFIGRQTPPGVSAAPLRCPQPPDLVNLEWWAFGFANGDPVGNSADGLVGASLGYGWIRLDAKSRYHVEPGFSGGGLWSPDYGAVVAIVGEANSEGDGRAITLFQADLCLPGEGLRALTRWSAEAASELALAAWGWSLGHDQEAGRHWWPRARGVSIDSARGYRFRGRAAALTAIVNWLDQPRPARRALVVTGSPGVGKSAVLGRIVTTADPSVRAYLPPNDDAIRATSGSVGCAVHVKGKTALQVAMEIACGASARLPDDVADTGPALRAALSHRGGQRFNVIIDALDEAASPRQARSIITDIVVPLVETCSDVGAQVIVGSRHSDDGGNLIRYFGDAIVTIDLDAPEYFAEADLAAYASACLQLAGGERPGNPYADDAVAHALGSRIAKLAAGNFLVAGIIARAHGMHDSAAARPEELGASPTVDSALAAYLDKAGRVTDVPAGVAMTALAFAEPPGWPIDLWRLAIEATDGKQVGQEQLTHFARSSAANFLVESGEKDTGPVFRLFHQALNDALLHKRSQIFSRPGDEQALTRAFARYGGENSWKRAPEYLLNSLPSHAARGGIIDELLTDDAYLIYVNMRRLLPLADRAVSPQARHRARLLQLTPQAITASPGSRAALFSVTEALENLGHGYRSRDWGAPYRALWGSAKPRTERAALIGHHGWVNGVCEIPQRHRPLLASASDDTTVRIWDPATSEQQAVLTGHDGPVRALCTFTSNDRTLLASASDDTTVRIWDPATAQQQAVLTGHDGPVNGITAIARAGRTLLASASDDTTVRIWDPATAQQQAVLTGHQSWVRGICAFTLGSRALLASAGTDRAVRIWDPATGQQQTTLTGHQSWVRGICEFNLGGRVLLASASEDTTVRIWDPATGQQQAVLTGHQGSVNAITAFSLRRKVMLASTGSDRAVRIWDPATGEQHATLTGHQSWVNGVCAFTLGGRILLASASEDTTVRIWDPAASRQRVAFTGHRGWVNAICAFSMGSQVLLASVGSEPVARIWDPATGEQHAALTGHQDSIRGVCSFALGGRILLASASEDTTVRVWDPASTACLATIPTHHGALAADQVGDSVVIALTAGLLCLALDPAL